MKNVFTISIFLLLFMMSCSDSETPFDPNLGAAPVDPNEVLFADLINDFRQSGGVCSGVDLPAVGNIVFNDTLNQVAESHAIYINNLDELTHIGDGQTVVGDRLMTAGYTFTSAAENLAKGYADEESVIDAWKNSTGHCENLLRANVTAIGVGTAGNYWVLVLAGR